MSQKPSQASSDWAFPPPPKQRYDAAVTKAWQALGDQAPDQIAWLGGVAEGGAWKVPVLGDTLCVDAASMRATSSAGPDIRAEWLILVLHYLVVANRPEPCPPEVTFADLPHGRGYSDVYDNRVLKRLCSTAGREAAVLRRAAEALGGREVPGGDAAFQFAVFPRVPIRLVWYAADDEFPPSATFLLPSNVEEFFPTEDIVVLCECCVSRLSGRPF